MRNRVLATAAALAIVAAALAMQPAGAAPPSAHVRSGAAWLKSQVKNGFVLENGKRNLSDTVQTATALADAVHAGAKGHTVLDAMENYLSTRVDKYIDGGLPPSATNDNAGALARMILLRQALGVTDPADLVARLEATQQPTGLFGASDPSYDGSLRQGLAMVALHTAGVAWTDPTMVNAQAWLLAQQCSNGGFSADAASPLTGCTDDPADYLGPDTNATSMALWALSTNTGAPSVSAAISNGLQFLATAERPLAEWSFMPGSRADCDSTALVDLALFETGQNLSSRTGEWAVLGTSPIEGLERFQIGITGTPSNRGGFRYQRSPSYLAPDVLSSEQALLTLSIVGG